MCTEQAEMVKTPYLCLSMSKAIKMAMKRMGPPQNFVVKKISHQ